jgi:hypothetical protein
MLSFFWYIGIKKWKWDGRGNVRTVSDEINWNYRHVDFDMAVYRTEGGKILTVRRDKNHGRKN